MKLAIFGGSGKTGQEVIREALERGHWIKSLVRPTAVIKERSENLKILSGQITNKALIADTVREADAVICVLGWKNGSPKDFCSTATRDIIEAMETASIRRLVVQTGAMIGHQNLGPFYRFMLKMLPGSQEPVVEDRRLQESIVRESRVHWTIVRPPRLTNGPARGGFQAGSDLLIKWRASISRKDLAKFLLDTAASDALVRKGVAISY